jgi:predicted NUDIX family phosphoesterase
MSPEKANELIIGVPVEDLFDNKEIYFNGVETRSEIINRFMKNMNDAFLVRRRGPAENDPLFKQLIPYAIIKQGDQYFSYERLKGGGESRLFNKLSLGVGGHMNYTGEKDSIDEAVSKNLFRELNEELIIQNNFHHMAISLDVLKPKVVGLVNDDNNTVGQVHLGIIYLIEIALDVAIKVREKDTLKGLWLTKDLLNKSFYFDRLESWSQLFVKHIL